MNVVIVESPSKARTIGKYLGSNFKVLASYGHVRDLPSKNGSVDPEHDFAMIWEVSNEGKKNLKLIGDAVQKADAIYLATDPDREGEAIAWHVLEVLKEKKLLKDKAVYRSVFHEVNKKAIVAAIENPRTLNQELVEAYLARRALDYLVGFTLSPILWRKLPGSKSAGRVQSVALRLITEREAEIEKFKTEEYWTIEGTFKTQNNENFLGRLTHLNEKKLTKFSLNTEALAKDALAQIEPRAFTVGSVEKKQAKRHPSPPFITSTLQQEAARKLYFGASRTMQLAQSLYEGVELKGETVGLITYMRTDSVNVSADFITTCRDYIEKEYGAPYKPEAPRFYKSKAKNAQEAHEAIRPTDLRRTPESLASLLDPQQLKLYALIWKRALASQMESAILDQVAADLISDDKKITFRSTGSTIKFDGFFCLYREGKDEEDEDDQEKNLPALNEGAALHKEDVRSSQHFTQPPPRYTEASLVKKMEELGIGRPSTYASILHVLQLRHYVILDKRQFIPDGRGRLVSTFLENFFKKYVEYDFTASLENELDEIAEGSLPWKNVLTNFWKEFKAAVDQTKDLKISDVLDVLDKELGVFFFPSNNDDRTCPSCKKGKLHLKLGRFGAFIGCTDYPECKHTQRIGEDSPEEEREEGAAPSDYPKVLGKDPVSSEEITVRKGPYGFYIQLGEAKGKEKPKRISLLKDMDPATVSFDEALSLLSLPKDLGKHPETGDMLTLGIGRFGPYVKHGKTFASIKEDNILEVTPARAIAILTEQSDNKSYKKKNKG
jgi:DNA topoisomerase-1